MRDPGNEIAVAICSCDNTFSLNRGQTSEHAREIARGSHRLENPPFVCDDGCVLL